MTSQRNVTLSVFIVVRYQKMYDMGTHGHTEDMSSVMVIRFRARNVDRSEGCGAIQRPRKRARVDFLVYIRQVPCAQYC